jgi:hypothetical protein
MDRWQSFPVQFTGGLITNVSPLQQGINAPGSALTLRNFEPSVSGGYRRILGYTKWDPAEITGTGNVRGVIEFGQNAIAVRNGHVYESGGSGWTQLTDNAAYSSTGITLGGTDGKIRFTEHKFGTTRTLIIVDGDSKPCKYDGTTFSRITSAPADVDGANNVIAHKNHLFFSKGSTLSFTAPFDDSDFTAASGAGTIVFETNITDLIVFRENLIVFSENNIHQISGSSIADFQLLPITQDVGAIYEDTAREIGGDIMFMGPDGLRLLSATERNNDFGLAVVSKPIQQTMLEFEAGGQSFTAVTIRRKSQYRVLAYNAAYTDTVARGVIGTQFAGQGGEGMQWSETRGINAYVSCSTLNGTEEYVLFANDDGYVYRMEDGNSFDGANIRSIFKTPHLPITDPSTRKTMYKMRLFVDPQGGFRSNVSTEYNYGDEGTIAPPTQLLSNDTDTASFYGNSTYGTGVYGGKIKYIFDLNLSGSGYVVSFTFDSESTDPPYSFDSMILQYGQYGRR